MNNETLKRELEIYRMGNQPLHQLVKNLLVYGVDSEQLKRFVWGNLIGVSSNWSLEALLSA